ncbi:MAG: fibronectin type III domain-containing protein, partial [Chitinophagales bacterium]|nr:fibronectin type III domain-containing protein [Chitinophagales bacterium]
TQAPTITNINDTTVSLTNLTPTTTYYVWVRSVCSATDSSNWSNISSFRTLCPTPVNPTILSATATTFDVSWTAPTQSTPASYSVFYSTNNTIPSLTQTPTTNNIQTTYIQPIGLSPTTNYYVWVRSVCSQSDSSAWVSADSIRTLCPLPTNVTTSLITDSTANIHWNVPLESTPSSYSVFYSTNNTIPSLTQAPRYSGMDTTSVNLTNLRTGNNYYVWVRSVCSATDSSAWTNMVSIKTICNQPMNVQTTTITSLTATIKWDTLSSGSSAMYEYYYSTNNTAPTISTIPNGTTTNDSIFLTGLTQNTIYYFWVRSNCGGGDYSNWSTVLSFSTTCNIAILPWTEGFETMPYVGNRVVPTCWSIFDNPNTNFIGTSNVNNGKQGPRTGSNYATANEQFSEFYTPGFELKAGATYTFSFYAVNKGYVDNSFKAYYFLTLRVKKQGGGYSIIEELAYQQEVNNTTYQQFSYTIQPTTDNVYYFNLRPSINTFSNFSLSFDDFKLERSCSNPENVSVTNISGTSADINWVAPIASTPSSYNIYYSTNNAIPSETQAPTIAGVTSTSTNISGLNPSTTYYVWVRSICSATDTSAWTNITSFTTQCITPTTQPTALQLIPAANFVAGSFTAASPAVHGYLVVRTNGTPPTDPVDGTTYNVGDNALGGVIVSNGLSTNFTANGLIVNNNYSFYVYAYNNTGCVGNKYLTATPLTGSATTTALFVSLKNGVWHDTTTWNQRAAPTATDDVKINTGHTVTVNEVTGNASTLTIEGNLSVTTGTLNASTIYLNGTTAMALTAANAIINTNNIIHNTDGNINVTGSGYLNVNESFAFGNVNNRTFTTGGRLVLKSTATGTARIADITNGGANTGNLISGNVAQERFIPAKAVRKWIFLSSPVAQSIASSWQHQIHITGAGTGGNVCPNIGINSNGFDATGSNAPNVYTYNAANIAGSRWTTLANTSEQVGRGVGFRVNVRGDRSLGCSLLDGTPAGLVPSAVTLKATGGLSNAQKNIGSFSITYPNVGINNYVFIGNPYPSAISFSALQTANNTIINNIYAIYIPTNAAGIYTYWDGNTNTFTGGTGYDNTTGNLIANGQAVFVKSAVAGDVTLSFAENQKITETNVGYFRTARVFNEMIKVSLSQNNKPIDEAVIRFASDADISNTEVGNLDIASMNSGTYISSLKANKGMVVQTRDVKTLNNDEVWLNIGATTSGTYQLNFSEFENFVGTDILLTDHFTNTTQSIKQNDTYEFSVDKDNAATKGQNRFSITFNRKITPVYVSNTIKMYPNPASKQVTLELPQTADNNIVYNIKITDLAGRIIMQQKINAGTHQLTIDKLTTGTYFVELIDSKGNRRTEKLVKQ